MKYRFGFRLFAFWMIQKREKELRKRLNHFLSDLAILGSLQVQYIHIYFDVVF